MTIQSIDLSQIVAALIGLVGIIYSKTPRKKTKRGTKKPHQIILILSILLLIVAAAVFSYRHWFLPQVSIDKRIMDERGSAVDKNKAPFRIFVDGSVSNAEGLFLYLVVDDGNAEYIMPGLGQGYNGNFSGTCYLGVEDDPKSLNKRYIVFAVVTDRKYKKFEHLNRTSMKATSNRIKLFR